MVCKLCKAYGTCNACRQGHTVRITGSEVVGAMIWTLVATVLAVLYLLALQ